MKFKAIIAILAAFAGIFGCTVVSKDYLDSLENQAQEYSVQASSAIEENESLKKQLSNVYTCTEGSNEATTAKPGTSATTTSIWSLFTTSASATTTTTKASGGATITTTKASEGEEKPN